MTSPTHEQPSTQTRYVKRGQVLVLQQLWSICVLGQGTHEVRTEWRDVPVVEE